MAILNLQCMIFENTYSSTIFFCLPQIVSILRAKKKNFLVPFRNFLQCKSLKQILCLDIHFNHKNSLSTLLDIVYYNEKFPDIHVEPMLLGIYEVFSNQNLKPAFSKPGFLPSIGITFLCRHTFIL